jgi:hypothetical protein
MALLDDEELLPFFGNPNVQRQGARARALAARRDVNTLPDPRTYAAISGLLGQAPDEMGFSVLNPDYEGIQRVARPAFAAGTALGIAPMMRGMNLAPRRAVPAPSAKSQLGAFLMDTPKKPNPLVGTRYQTNQLPGIVPRRDVNYDEMLGGSMMTYPTDMLSRNVQVTNVSEIPLGANAFTTPGGLMYMRDLENIKNLVGYASNPSAATAQNNRALQAIKENKDRGGTGRIFMAPHTMPRSGENFSTGPTEGLLAMIDATNPSPKLLEMISDQMRSATVKKVKGKYKDFVGLNDPAARLQLLTGEGLSAGSAGDLRKIFVDKMSNVATERGLDFNYKDLQNSMLDPNVMNRPSFWMGDSIYEALPQLGTRPGSHAAYGMDMPGVFFGNTRGAPISEVMQPVYNKILPTQMNKPGSGTKNATMQDLFTQLQMPGDIPSGNVYADPNQLTRGKLSTAGEGISMFMDEAQIKRLKRLFGQE